MTDLLIQLTQFAKDFEEGIDFKFYNKYLIIVVWLDNTRRFSVRYDLDRLTSSEFGTDYIFDELKYRIEEYGGKING